MSYIRSSIDLKVWQEAMGLVKQVYVQTQKFPKEEIYGLTSQIRRAAVSIPSNIAEGNGRKTRKDYLNFLAIANGSLMELKTQILIAESIQYMNQEETDALLKQIDTTGRMLTALRKSLETSNP
jgi:four helix bundle protein